jgi:protein ImuB
VGRAQRIEAGWFDGVATRRDYHLAVGVDGRRCYWIYREHAPGHAARWFLHGLFG